MHLYERTKVITRFGGQFIWVLFFANSRYGNDEVHKKCSHERLSFFGAFYHMLAVLNLLITRHAFAGDFAASGFSVSLSLSLLSEYFVAVCGKDDIVALPLSISPDSPSSLCEKTSLTLLLSCNVLSIPKATCSTFGLPPETYVISSIDDIPFCDSHLIQIL